MLICDLPVEIISYICADIATAQIARLFGTLNHRIQERLSHPNVIPYLLRIPSNGDPNGLIRYLFRSIQRPNLIEYSYGSNDFDHIISSHPYGLHIKWNQFKEFFDFKLPPDLESLKWLVSDGTCFAKTQSDYDWEDEHRRRAEAMWESDSEDNDARSDSSGKIGEESENEADKDENNPPSSKPTSEASSEPETDNNEIPSESSSARPSIPPTPEPRPTVASRSLEYWPPSLTELDLAFCISKLYIWSELTRNLPSTLVSLRLRPTGAWTPVNYGNEADFFIEDAWIATPSLTRLKLAHPELRSRFAESDAVKKVLSDDTDESLANLPFDGPIPANLDWLSIETIPKSSNAMLATNIMPSLRTLKFRYLDGWHAPLSFSLVRHFFPPGLTSLLYPGCIDLSISDSTDPRWQAIIPSSLTDLRLYGTSFPMNCLLVSQERTNLKKFALYRANHSYQELEETKMLSLRQIPRYVSICFPRAFFRVCSFCLTNIC